jgi:acetyl/propionyl-CoA carboxylase alpha subunit
VGEALPFTQAQVSQRGHAVECRVYAEDPANGFLPAIGTILRLVEPQGPGIRVDSGVGSGDEITIHYDPMIAKLIVYGQDRAEAIQRMTVALSDYVILGLTTNIHFLKDLINTPEFVAGNATTALIERSFGDWQPPNFAVPDEALIAAALMELFSQPEAQVEGVMDGDMYSAWAQSDGFRLGQR